MNVLNLCNDIIREETHEASMQETEARTYLRPKKFPISLMNMSLASTR